MTGVLTSLIRTAASKLVGGLLGLAASLGIAVPADLSEEATVALATALMVLVQMAYYVAARWTERRWPWLGRLLLWSRLQPVYQVPQAVAAAEVDAARFRQ